MWPGIRVRATRFLGVRLGVKGGPGSRSTFCRTAPTAPRGLRGWSGARRLRRAPRDIASWSSRSARRCRRARERAKHRDRRGCTGGGRGRAPLAGAGTRFRRWAGAGGGHSTSQHRRLGRRTGRHGCAVPDGRRELELSTRRHGPPRFRPAPLMPLPGDRRDPGRLRADRGCRRGIQAAHESVAGHGRAVVTDWTGLAAPLALARVEQDARDLQQVAAAGDQTVRTARDLRGGAARRPAGLRARRGDAGPGTGGVRRQRLRRGGRGRHRW